jgi:hypothetical protein
MGPHEGPSFLGMALVTEFVDRTRLDLRGAKTSVVFVAIRAFHFSFPNRMVGSTILLGPDILMAEIA